MATTLPPLITTEGLVLNNQMPGEGALGNYTPKGTASSEGISLLMRGILRAAQATGDASMKEYASFLFDAACKYFFKGQRPSDVEGELWNHSWICNGGAAFSVRGPLATSGDLALAGYIYGRDPESTVLFTAGVGNLYPPPDICYQVVSEDAAFVWPNVFSDLTSGTPYEVDYYIDVKGNKVFGTQKGGSFGQPAIPAGQHTDGAPGKIVLKTPVTANCGVNYNRTVTDVVVGYGELYEAWPMWRKLAEEEVSTAADAIHWFIDAFQLGRELDPSNVDWTNALNRMQEIWETTCNQESNSTYIFKGGADGTYNNFPLTYSYGYGRDNIDKPSTNWDVVPPSDRYTAERTTDGYVSFTMPAADAVIGTGRPIRYGVAFENKPLFLDYTQSSSVMLSSHSTQEQILDVTIADNEDKQFSASVLLGSTPGVVEIGLSQFLQFQQAPGDAAGTQTGDWETDETFIMPSYPAVPWPGRRMALVGDSITAYNAAYIPAKDGVNLYENYGFGYGGWWVNAEQILRGRTMLEHGIQPNLTGRHTGTSFAVAGTKVQDWWQPQDFPASPNTPEVGPMYAALHNLSKFDMVCMLGGTNDLSGNAKALHVLNRLKRASTDLAKEGKWVFLGVITPRTRFYLRGYTYIEQTQIFDRIKEVNQGLRDWITNERPANIFLVDWYSALLGPNGQDPAGLSSHPSNPNGDDILGNYRSDAPGVVFFHDGLHPGPGAGRIMGEKLAEVVIAAGVPSRENQQTLGPLTLGPNLVSNPTFGFSPFDTTPNPNNYNQTDIGWAYGLGAQKLVGTLHDGFEYGKIPNNWRFARSTNAEDISMGTGVGGVYTNFLGYMYSGAIGQFPAIAPYTVNSTWPDGSVLVSIGVHENTAAVIIDVDMPVTGNKNESFVLMTDIPRRQHGVWDNYGYNGPDQGNEIPMVVPNTQYFPGDMLLTETDVVLQGLNATMHSCQSNLLIIQQNPAIPTGAKLSTFGNHPFMYPPSDMDKIRFHTKDRMIQLRAPAILVPQANAGETMQYATLKFEIGFDASKIGPKGRIIIKNPRVMRVTGGTPL